MEGYESDPYRVSEDFSHFQALMIERLRKEGEERGGGSCCGGQGIVVEESEKSEESEESDTESEEETFDGEGGMFTIPYLILLS